jgi:hypothetical protein
MKIFLDTRDLINVVERNAPVPLKDFEAFLRGGNHRLVLSNTSVREFAGPLAKGEEFLRLRPLLQSLERLPVTYIKEIMIIGDELKAGVAGFNAGLEPQALSPFVNRWDRTMVPLPDGRRGIAEMLVGLRLDEIIYFIFRTNPQVFAAPAHRLQELRDVIEADRDLLRKGQSPSREHFIRSVKKHANTKRVLLPRGREDEFAEWLYKNPNRCPGLRLNYEIFRAITSNYGDRPQVGDFGDIGQIFAIPYVDVATLDNRIRDYLRTASRKITRMGGLHNFSDRVYRDLTEIMATYPLQ